MNEVAELLDAAVTTEDLLERLRAEAVFMPEPGSFPTLERTGRGLAEAVHELRLRVDGISDVVLLNEIDQVAGDLRYVVSHQLFGEVSWQTLWALEDETRVRLSRLASAAST